MNNSWCRSELTYCTNVHPGESLQQVYGVISGPLARVRQNRGLGAMGGGLWLSNATALDLSSDADLDAFRARLQQNGIALFTLNGFPTQGFHAQRVKQAVYHPDWSEPERLHYTLRLARILSVLLAPDQAEGTISSVPLGFAPEWNPARDTLAMDALGQCLLGLEEIHRQGGRRIRLCLEMEPGCVLESTDELIPYFTSALPQHLNNQGLSSELIDRHLGICFDVCHQAVMFEDCYDSLSRIRAAGIHVGKIQISSALQLNAADDSDARNSLAGFIEDRYLHQSRCLDSDGQLLKVMDLDQAFTDFPRAGAWRTHFHVPIQAETLISDGLGTTQRDICRTLDFLRDNPGVHPHLEVETYTWTALPEEIRPQDDAMIIDGLTAELQWLESEMQSRRLLREEPS